jgi:hypothetical protein
MHKFTVLPAASDPAQISSIWARRCLPKLATGRVPEGPGNPAPEELPHVGRQDLVPEVLRCGQDDAQVVIPSR